MWFPMLRFGGVKCFGFCIFINHACVLYACCWIDSGFICLFIWEQNLVVVVTEGLYLIAIYFLGVLGDIDNYDDIDLRWRC